MRRTPPHRRDLPLIRVNGEPMVSVALRGGRVFSVLSFVIDGKRISRIYNMRNPDKLKGVALSYRAI